MFLHWTGNNLDLITDYPFVYSRYSSGPSISQGQISGLFDGNIIREFTPSGDQPIALNSLGSLMKRAASANGQVFVDAATGSIAAFLIENNQSIGQTISGSSLGLAVNDLHMDPSGTVVALALNNTFTGEIPFRVYVRSGTTWTNQTLSVPVDPAGNGGTNYADYDSQVSVTVRYYSSSQIYVSWAQTFGNYSLVQRYDGTSWVNETALTVINRSACDWNPTKDIIVYGVNNSLEFYNINISTNTRSSAFSMGLPGPVGSVIKMLRWNPTGTYLAVLYDQTPYVNIYTFTQGPGNPGTFTKLTTVDALDGLSSNVDISWSADSNYLFLSGVPYSRSGDTFTRLDDTENIFNSRFVN